MIWYWKGENVACLSNVDSETEERFTDLDFGSSGLLLSTLDANSKLKK